jgi:hypothetical protein
MYKNLIAAGVMLCASQIASAALIMGDFRT